MTVRQLEAMIRLGEARARVDLSEQITRRHIQEARRLLKESIMHVSHDDVDVIDQVSLRCAFLSIKRGSVSSMFGFGCLGLDQFCCMRFWQDEHDDEIARMVDEAEQEMRKDQQEKRDLSGTYQVLGPHFQLG